MCFLKYPGISFRGAAAARKVSFSLCDSVWKGHRRAGALMRRDDQVLSLLSLKGFPLFSCIKDSLIGLRTPCRCYQLAKYKKKKGRGRRGGKSRGRTHAHDYIRWKGEAAMIKRIQTSLWMEEQCLQKESDVTRALRKRVCTSLFSFFRVR